MIFEGSPNSLTAFFFTRELRLGGFYFTDELGAGESKI